MRNYGSTPDLTIIVPVEVNRHWRVCIAQASTEGNIVKWGDSLDRSKWFHPTCKVMCEIMVQVDQNGLWVLRDVNLMELELNCVRQTDIFSCGFYVVSCIAHFATNLKTLQGYGYEKE